MATLTFPTGRCLKRLSCRAPVLLALASGVWPASASSPNPALGLTFVIDRLDRPWADPPVHRAHYARAKQAEAPAAEPTMAASTALGLHGVRLGRPRSVALKTAAQHLKPLRPISVVSDTKGSGAAPVSSASFAGSAHHASLVFRDGTLSEVGLDYKPQRLLARTQRWSRAAAAGLFALLHTAATLAGLADFGRGNAYAGMAVATLGFYGLTGLMGGAVLLGIGRKISSLA
jgi:hypothetical protein